MEPRAVHLHLPRFEVEDSYDLDAVLAAMGMADAFREHEVADSGTSPRSGLQAQKFLHRSLMAVTEEGTEAAAATGMGLAVTPAAGWETFLCDHPFLFFVRHNDSSSIIFFGRLAAP